jgi:High-affinity nickel-transport protein
MPGLTVSGSPRIGAMVRQSYTAMTTAERTRVTAMYGAIAGLHLLGFVVLFVFVVPSHYEGLGIGVAILAYTLGLRHAFDADHISAVDNTTRKVLGELQPRHHRAVRGHLLVHRRHRGPQLAHPSDRRAQPQPRLVGLPVQLQPQHGRLGDRGHVHRHLAGRHAHLALRPDRGEVNRPAAAPNARRHGPRAACAEGGEPRVIYSVCNNPGGA